MTAKQNPKEASAEKPIEFTKAQILSAIRYTENKDIISVVLSDNKKYSLEEVDSLIKNFLKGTVK